VSEQSDRKQIGSRIREVRTSRSMSQAELADKASLSLPLISNIENGKKDMMLDTFIRIAEALQISTDYLIRAEVPDVKPIYKNEISDLLDGCTAREMESILNIVRQIKTTMDQQKNND